MTFQHRAGISPYTSAYAFAETCVFDKQLLGPFHCDHLTVAPLLPKLRGHFAEFLNNGYLVRLMILSSSTCVGLRYGHSCLPSSFSRQCEFVDFITIFIPLHHLDYPQAFFTTCNPHDLDTLFHPRASTILLRPCFDSLSYFGGTGISTCCASHTPFGLRLAPDLPWVDKPSPGNLRLSTVWILTTLSLLMPAFSLLYSPSLLSV